MEKDQTLDRLHALATVRGSAVSAQTSAMQLHSTASAYLGDEFDEDEAIIVAAKDIYEQAKRLEEMIGARAIQAHIDAAKVMRDG